MNFWKCIRIPQKFLIIPKKVIPKLSDSTIEDQEVLGHLMLVAGKVAEQLNLDNTLDTSFLLFLNAKLDTESA